MSEPTNEMLPCPACSGTGGISHRPPMGRSGECITCGGTGGATRDDAVRYWQSKRTMLIDRVAAVDAELEKLGLVATPEAKVS